MSNIGPYFTLNHLQPNVVFYFLPQISDSSDTEKKFLSFTGILHRVLPPKGCMSLPTLATVLVSFCPRCPQTCALLSGISLRTTPGQSVVTPHLHNDNVTKVADEPTPDWMWGSKPAAVAATRRHVVNPDAHMRTHMHAHRPVMYSENIS